MYLSESSILILIFFQLFENNSCLFLYSGQVHIISEEHDDSDEYSTARPPRVASRPNTSRLDVSVNIYFIFNSFLINQLNYCLIYQKNQ